MNENSISTQVLLCVVGVGFVVAGVTSIDTDAFLGWVGAIGGALMISGGVWTIAQRRRG